MARTPRLLEALTPDEKAAYRERLADILRRADRLDGEMLDETKRLVRQAADRLTAEWARVVDEGTEWDAFITPRLQAALRDVAGELASSVGDSLNDWLPQGFGNGVDLVDAAIGGAGFSPALPAIAPEVVKIAASFSADLITNIEAWTLDRVNKVLQASFVTGESPWQTMQALARTGMDSGPWRSVAYRAEVVARTEIGRVQGLAAQRRMSDVHREFPDMGLRKAFMSAHILEWPCETCEPYDGTIWDVDDPEAPEVPVHANCRCLYVSYLPGLSTEVKRLGQDDSLHAQQRDESVAQED